MKRIGITLLLAMALLLTALPFAYCGAETATPSATETDYSSVANWLSKPAVTHAVDTFYIYPTAYLDPSPDAPVISDINDPGMRQNAVSVYNDQATVYEESTNVFAPYYRQVNMVFAATATEEERVALLEQEPKADLFAALDYYFEHLNEGRPFILAGHSQGSQMMLFVLSEYRKAHEEYFSRMVAAYVLGFSVTGDFLKDNPGLSFAQGADAQVNVERGVVITNADSEPIPDLADFGPQSFHNGDYPFYFMNIQENIAKRIETYFASVK